MQKILLTTEASADAQAEDRERLPGLTVAIATFGMRFLQLKPERFPPYPGVRYQIFVQAMTAEAPHHAGALRHRTDLVVTFLDGAGAAGNRNAAIAAVADDILLFADDDLVFCGETYADLRRRFAGDDRLDFICGRLITAAGLPRKAYRPDGQRVTRFNCGRVGTPELAIRPARFRAKALQFDPRFGAGAPLWLGDEYIFLCDALRLGLRGRHVALDLAVHPEESSGTVYSTESFEVRRQVINRATGIYALPLRWAFALKHRRRFPDGRSILRFLGL
ncbi:MAG: hypothetical protein ACEQSU_03425 [Microgenomates group bacterium]